MAKAGDTSRLEGEGCGRSRKKNFRRSRKISKSRATLALAFLVAQFAVANDINSNVEALREDAIGLAQDIFDFAELGYLETRSAKRLGDYLQANGFVVESGAAAIPTAFVAERGSGGPTIGILAEFDALPGLSQAPVPNRQPIVEGASGHACGHHLFGSASVVAAVAIADWLQAANKPGTVRVYGTPAEEGGSGKVYMTRAGLFNDVDIVLHWHPADRNVAVPESSTGNKSARFRFHGVAAHAASSAHRGRSALDGVEAMNYMTNLMREHMPSRARMHYVITEGGTAPNIVPELAEVYYYVRHPQVETLQALFKRIVAAAEGAALGTETRMEYEVMHGNYPLLPNEALAKIIHRQLTALGGVQYDESEMQFAETIRRTFLGQLRPLAAAREIQPFEFRQKMGSTDVGDVSWNVPTAGFGTATWVPGTPAHSWQAVAAGGMSIGHKGMVLAAKVLANTALALFANPRLIAEAKAEFERRRGEDFQYRPLLGDRDPPLDYRL